MIYMMILCTIIFTILIMTTIILTILLMMIIKMEETVSTTEPQWSRSTSSITQGLIALQRWTSAPAPTSSSSSSWSWSASSSTTCWRKLPNWIYRELTMAKINRELTFYKQSTGNILSTSFCARLTLGPITHSLPLPKMYIFWPLFVDCLATSAKCIIDRSFSPFA